MKSRRVWSIALFVTTWTIEYVESFVILSGTSAWNQHVNPLGIGTPKDESSANIERDHSEYFLRFLHSFQRHVVYDSNRSVLCSFEFLDSALENFPKAALIPQGTQSPSLGIGDDDSVYLGFIAGCGLQEQTAYRESLNTTLEQHSARIKTSYQALLTLSNLTAQVPQAQHAVARYLVEKSGKLRFIQHTPDTIRANFHFIIRTFETLLDMDRTDTMRNILSTFPQICLYDSSEIADRLLFFLAPLPPTTFTRIEVIDWPLLASHGYGAGMTKEQTRQALRAVPHLMAMYYEDASLKPEISYFLHVLQAPFHLANQASVKLRTYLDGATFSDIAHMTFLFKLGITWDQLRVILDAFPTIIVCDTQPSVEMLSKGVASSVRGIAPQKLHYLQSRLQIPPSHVKAMLIRKTHNRLGTYSILGKIKGTLDALQARLGLSSAEIRAMVRRQPSLIGMSAAENKGFNERVSFFLNEVSMTMKDLKTAVVRHPSLLEYNVNSTLRPKFAFFRDKLCVPQSKMAKLVSTTPGILGLSLEENLRPSTDQFMDYLELTPNEMGEILAIAPQILASSWKSNLEPKLRFLAKRLDIDTFKLKHIVKRAPRLLLYNVERSIEPKLLMIEEVLRGSASTCQLQHVVCRNPPLLVTTNELLRKRLDLATRDPLDHGQDISEFLLPRLSSSIQDIGLGPVDQCTPNGKDLLVPPPQLCKEVDVSSAGLVHDIASSNYTLERGYAPGVFPIVVYVAGRIYPRDSRSRVRGSQQSGGVSLFFPQVAYGSPEFKLKFEQIARACFPQSVPESESECFGIHGITSFAFPGLRPSRTRAELAACHSALRAVLLLLVQEAASNARATDDQFQVDIYTGSDAVWRLLRNETRLIEWSKHNSTKAFKSCSVGSRPPNNADLLLPLCRTVSRMMTSCSVIDQNGNEIILGKQVKIRFLHTSDGNPEEESIRTLGALARVAAKWYYSRIYAPDT